MHVQYHTYLDVLGIHFSNLLFLFSCCYCFSPFLTLYVTVLKNSVQVQQGYNSVSIPYLFDFMINNLQIFFKALFSKKKKLNGIDFIVIIYAVEANYAQALFVEYIDSFWFPFKTIVQSYLLFS